MLSIRIQLVSIFILFVWVSRANPIKDTLYKEGDLQALFSGINEDKLLQIERMAAYEFHQLINVYRQSKKLKTLYWDDKLWLAARNHSVYLIQNCKSLTHTESAAKTYFTGKEPSDRMDYVTYGSKEYAFGGFENCAVSGEMVPESALKSLPQEITWAEMVELARGTASEMFELWKHSPGHNTNMLEKEHLAHGTSIVFGEHANYATSVFTQVQEYYSPDSLVLSFHENSKSYFPHRYTEKGQPYKPYPNGLGRTEYKIFQKFATLMQSNNSQPDKTLYQMTKLEDLMLIDKQKLHRIYLKSTHFASIFKLPRFDLVPLQFSGLCSEEDFFSLKPIEVLANHYHTSSALARSTYWGGNLTVKRNEEGKITYTLTTLSMVQKK